MPSPVPGTARWVVLLAAVVACGSAAGCNHETAPLPTFLDAVGSAAPNPPRPVDDHLFAMPASASSAAVVFEGQLRLRGPLFAGQALAYVQDGRDLIPVRRGLVEEAFQAWGTNWYSILEPGHIWQGPGGRALASLPIALVPRNSNCSFNGVLAFTFDGHDVSDVWGQLTAETCLGHPIDVAAWSTATYEPGGIADAPAVRAGHAEEVAHRFPTKPIAELALDYPSLDLSAFGRNIREVSVYGFVVNGVDYVSDCPTRHGRYAYCDVMRLPSFSTAKSAFAGIAFLRLGQKFGLQIAGLPLQRYVPELRESAGAYPGWETVTIEDVLDLASGHYGAESTY